MKEIKHKQCLLLNADYTPIRIISWKKAIIWSMKYDIYHKYGIEIISYYDDEFIQGTNEKKYAVPAVAKTRYFFNLYHKTINFSRKNLFIRDNYTCQYCGQKLPISQLTYDHVIPKSRFDIKNKHKCTNWINIVTSCWKCNHKKGNKTPKEANMVLLNQPVVPKYCSIYLPWYRDFFTIDGSFPEWAPFIQDFVNNESKCI